MLAIQEHWLGQLTTEFVPFRSGFTVLRAGEIPPKRLMTNRKRVLFLLQEQRRLLAQYWKKVFRCLRQEPRQRHFDAQCVLQHFDTRRRSLAKRTHPEVQRISFPSLLLHRDRRSELPVGAGEAFFKTADRLALPETMADDDCDGITH